MKFIKIRGTDTFFSPPFEKGVYVYSVIIAIAYIIFEYVNVKLFSGNNIISHFLYFFPPICTLIVSILLLIKKEKKRSLYIWQAFALDFFIIGHFFPFHSDLSSPDFHILSGLLLLLGILVLYLPFIISHILILLSFKRKIVIKEPENGTPYLINAKYLRQQYFLYIILPTIVLFLSFIIQSILMFFIVFLVTVLGSFYAFYYDAIRKIYPKEDHLLFLSANKSIILPWRDINRLSLQKGFLDVKKVLGLNLFTDKAHNYQRMTINKNIIGYKELVPIIINKCDHFDASFTAKLLKDFQEGNANQK